MLHTVEIRDDNNGEAWRKCDLSVRCGQIDKELLIKLVVIIINDGDVEALHSYSSIEGEVHWSAHVVCSSYTHTHISAHIHIHTSAHIIYTSNVITCTLPNTKPHNLASIRSLNHCRYARHTYLQLLYFHIWWKPRHLSADFRPLCSHTVPRLPHPPWLSLWVAPCRSPHLVKLGATITTK